MIKAEFLLMCLKSSFCVSSVVDVLMHCEIECDNVDVNNDSNKKAAEIPPELISVSAECQVTITNFSRNCLTAVPTGSVSACTHSLIVQ